MEKNIPELSLWVDETHEDNIRYSYRCKKSLFSEKSSYQQIDVVETHGLGKMLLNDGLIMVSERDEMIYHEMMAHVPLYTHPNPKNVLVIGGGDGGTAREVIRHPSIEKCTMVEIDEVVVRACLEHIPQTSKAMQDPKVDVIIEDGLKFVRDTQEKYDVILIDSTDPIGPATPLFGPEFYQDIHQCLTNDGIVVSQAESPFYNPKMQKTVLTLLGELFPIVQIYNYNNLTYPGGLWSFSFGSKKYRPNQDFQLERYRSDQLQTHFYNHDMHTGSFAQPQFVLDNLGDLIRP